MYVVTPPATTPKMLMVAFCNTLGLPHTRRQNAQELTEQIIRVLQELRTTLVILDEIHNVHSNRRVGAEAASTLKLFAERVDAAQQARPVIVGVGLLVAGFGAVLGVAELRRAGSSGRTPPAHPAAG